MPESGTLALASSGSFETTLAVALRYLEGYSTQGIQPFNLGGATDPGFGTPAAELLFDRRDFAFPGYPEGLTDLTGRRMRLASAGRTEISSTIWSSVPAIS